jgi:hypothetical protein
MSDLHQSPQGPLGQNWRMVILKGHDHSPTPDAPASRTRGHVGGLTSPRKLGSNSCPKGLAVERPPMAREI